MSERERVWATYRETTINPPKKADFDRFWEGQNGVRGLFLMDNLVQVPVPVPFKVYGRGLEWGYPMGVGYRYLNQGQALLLLRMASLSTEQHDGFLKSVINRDQSARCPQR